MEILIKKDNKFRDRVRYLLQMMKILWKNDKIFFVTSIIEIIIVSILPFVSMYLLSYTINAFTIGVDFWQYAIIATIFLIVWLVLLATKALENGSFTALIVNFKNIVASIVIICGVVVIISQVDLWLLLITLFVILFNSVLLYAGSILH